MMTKTQIAIVLLSHSDWGIHSNDYEDDLDGDNSDTDYDDDDDVDDDDADDEDKDTDCNGVALSQ